MYCCSLFYVSSRDEWTTSNKSTNKERRKFQQLSKETEKIEFSFDRKNLERNSSLLSSPKYTHALRLRTCTTTLSDKSLEAPEYVDLRKFVHGIDKSDYMSNIASKKVSGEPSKKKQ